MRTVSRSAGVVSLRLTQAVLSLGILMGGREALANTITQNTSWTIDRPGTTAKYRVVAYGDSIFAGYNGSLSNVDKRAASWVQGEYLSNAWNTDIDVIRRTKSGAKADDIYNNKIVAEKSYMADASTRVVTFEMCGNDFLQARDAFTDQTGTCNYGVLDTALASCTKYQELAMQFINANASAATKKKMIMNLYYPGYGADNTLTSCKDGATGKQVNRQEAMFPRLVRSNWRACNFAAKNGFDCVDAFAEYMGADYDSNGDGKIDSTALRFAAGSPRTPTYSGSRARSARRSATRTPTSPPRARASITSSPTTRTPRTRGAPFTSASSAARARARARRTTRVPRSWAARTRSGTSSATSAPDGCTRSSPRPRPEDAMTKNRPVGSSRGGPRRSVDRDGVVRVELRQGGLPIGMLALGVAGLGLIAFLLWPWRRGDSASSASSAALAASARARSIGALAAPARSRSKDAPTLRVAARSPDTAAPSSALVIGAEVHNDTSTPGVDEPSEDSLGKGAIAGVEGKGRRGRRQASRRSPRPGPSASSRA